MPNARIVNPPKPVWVNRHLGSNPERGLLVEWRQSQLMRAGRHVAQWEGLVVWVAMIRGDGRDEWSVRVEWLAADQFREVGRRGD